MSKSILLIDDDRRSRKASRLFLESNGFSCREADNGSEALALLDGGLTVDLVITDYHMPVIDGLAFLKALSYRTSGQHVRVILLSGNLTKEMERAARQAGAFAVLEKPYVQQELLTLISQGDQP